MNDMNLFLRDVLTGAKASRQRHLRQAALIQQAIDQHWGLANPHRWQAKHLRWFLEEHSAALSPASRYRYWLTIVLLARRRHRLHEWQPHLHGPWQRPAG